MPIPFCQALHGAEAYVSLPSLDSAQVRARYAEVLGEGFLAEHLAKRGLTGADADEYVFVGPEGGPLDYSDWYHRVWEPAATQLGSLR